MTRSDSASRLASLSNATTTAPASTSSRQTAVPMPPPPAPAITTRCPVRPRRSSSIGSTPFNGAVASSGGRQSRLRAPKRALGHHRYHAGMLRGRVVLVTGGGAGIGRAIALGLEDAHATVIALDGDLASRASTEAAFAEARDAAGPLDAVV